MLNSPKNQCLAKLVDAKTLVFYMSMQGVFWTEGGYGFNMPLQINKSLILKPKNGENYGQIQWKSLKIVPGSTSPGCTVDISSET